MHKLCERRGDYYLNNKIENQRINIKKISE